MEGRTLASIEKKAEERGWTILFIDESAFYLLPGVVRTWAPVGKTPLLRCKLTRDHLSVISAISPKGDLFLKAQECAFTSQGILAFVEDLLAQIKGELLLIWDGATIHRSKEIQQYLAEGGAARLHLERLPGYAPELNPDEGIWNYLKRVELKNVCCRDIPHLKQQLQSAKQALKDKAHIIQACFQQAGLY